MLEIKNLSKSYNDIHVLENVNLEIEDLDWVILSGESGCGKTTFLKIITGLLDYDQGTIKYDGKRVESKDLQKLRKEEFSIVFQEKNLIPEYDVYQNLFIVCKERQKIDQLLNQFHLESLKHHRMNQLSGGQLQKIALIRALLKEPKILFLDEPTGNLDEKSTLEIIEILKEINKSITIFMISHDQSLFKYANKVVFLRQCQLFVEKKVEKNHLSLVEKINIKQYSFVQLLQMSIFNFIYYAKTYGLGLLAFSLICTGYIFSNNIGNKIDENLKKEMIQRDTEYELLIESEKIVTIDDIKEYSETTKANHYDLNLNLFLDQERYLFHINGNPFIVNESVHISSDYECEQKIDSIAISSKLATLLDVDKNDHIEVDLQVLSYFDVYETIYWLTDPLRLYEPQYVLETINLTGYQVIESETLTIYFNHYFIETLAYKWMVDPLELSNQQIKRFKLKYENYEKLNEARNYFMDHTTFSTYSIYDDFKGIEEEVKTQFRMFHYSSLILWVIFSFVILFILFMLDSYKKDQKRILHELGFTKLEKLILFGLELGMFMIITVFVSTISSYVFISIFNHLYDIQMFLPTSFIEFSKFYHLPLEHISWFDLTPLDIFEQLLFIIVPVIAGGFSIIHYRNSSES